MKYGTFKPQRKYHWGNESLSIEFKTTARCNKNHSGNKDLVWFFAESETGGYFECQGCLTFFSPEKVRSFEAAQGVV